MNSISVTGKKWVLKKFDQEKVFYLKENFSLDEITAKLLVLRNIKKEDVNSFLNPSIKNFLPNPNILLDMEKTTLRTVRAIHNKDKIGIFGDYDVDGATSTALLGKYFTELKLTYEIYIPDRKKEGYGPSIKIFKELIQKGVKRIFYSFDDVDNRTAKKLSYKTKTKKITVIHDSLFWDYPKNYSSLWRKYFISLINFGINEKTQIITTSNYSKKNLSKVIKKTTLIDFVYLSFENIIDFKNILASKIQLPESYILHIGSFEKRKDLITLVKAFHVIKKKKPNKKIKLVLAGAQVVNGNKKIIKQIKRYVLNNDLENEVILPNYISNEDAYQYYKNALMYVFPSLDEGFGIPIIEAFTYSLPVICSYTPIFKEIGNDSVCYFKMGDFISLSKKIQTLINSEDLRKEFSIKGKSQLNKFSRKKFIKGFEDLIID